MTEDASPENLRKFLESDDPAMVRMGLSMAKGSGVPEALLPTILSLYMWDDDKTIRATAKSVFIKWAPTEILAKVKKNWKANYRTLNIYKDKFQEIILPFLEAFKSRDDFALIALEPLIKALRYNKYSVRRDAAKALGKIGDLRAVEPLIKALKDKEEYVRRLTAEALGKIGDKRAVEPLIKAIGDEDRSVRRDAIKALGNIGDKRAVKPLIKALRVWFTSEAAEALVKIGDKRAVEPLIKAIGDEDRYVSRDAIKALGNIGDKRAVEPLIKALDDEDLDNVNPRDIGTTITRDAVAEALGNIGDKRAIKPLIKALEDNNRNVCNSSVGALVKIARAIKGKEQDNIIKFIESDDPAMVMMGASMLKGILEE